MLINELLLNPKNTVPVEDRGTANLPIKTAPI